MICYYEVLEIEDRTVPLENIKQNYKKLILRWHPDKNMDDPESAAETFKQVQQAWEVLSDPAERQWYDAHRDIILQGGEAEEFQGINLWPYFRPSCFNGYGDDDEGFYRVYAKVFKTLDEEESMFEEDRSPAPEFGNSQTEYSSVRLFYNSWEVFSTKKDFAWRDKHDIREAPNRYVRRIMEKENKKERDKGKKAFNEQVRRLAGSVKNRDQRVKVRVIQLEKERQEKQRILLEQQQQQAAAKIKETERILAEAKNEELDIDTLREINGTHSNDEDSQEEIIEEIFYCTACDREFKSENQLVNHFKSNKHKVNFIKLKEEVMTKEERNKYKLEEQERKVNGATSLEQHHINPQDPKQVENSELEKDTQEDEKRNQEFVSPTNSVPILHEEQYHSESDDSKEEPNATQNAFALLGQMDDNGSEEDLTGQGNNFTVSTKEKQKKQHIPET